MDIDNAEILRQLGEAIGEKLNVTVEEAKAEMIAEIQAVQVVLLAEGKWSITNMKGDASGKINKELQADLTRRIMEKMS